MEENLKNLLEVLVPPNKNIGSKPDVRCEICNTTLNEFRKSRLLGCPNCYNVFSSLIDKHLGHNESSHGKSHVTETSFLNKLIDDLAEAVEFEDFERAARLRDEIKQREKGGLLRDN